MSLLLIAATILPASLFTHPRFHLQQTEILYFLKYDYVCMFAYLFIYTVNLPWLCLCISVRASLFIFYLSL